MDKENRMTKPNNSMQRNWNEMEYNMLVKIFTAFHVMDLVINFSRVCRSWYSACCDPSIWNAQTLDLSVLGRYFFIPPKAKAWKDERSSQTYTRILRHAFDLSGETITKLIFHFHVYIKDEHLSLVAERCPRLQKLVLPRWHGLSLETLRRCLKVWGSTLESLMVPDICSPDELLVELIGENCPNLKELKFMTAVDKHLATSIVRFLPKLKVLSIRGTTIQKKALEFLMNEMQNLDILNITHCGILVHHPPVITVFRCSEANDIIKKRTRRPTHFFSCPDIMCSCRTNYGIRNFDEIDLKRRWYSSREDAWRVDEISSLSY